MINSRNSWGKTSSSSQASNIMKTRCRNSETRWRKWCQSDSSIQPWKRAVKCWMGSIKFPLRSRLHRTLQLAKVSSIIMAPLHSRTSLKRLIMFLKWIARYRKFHKYFLSAPWMDISQGATPQWSFKESRQPIRWVYQIATGDQLVL